jgi:plasmid stability protein
MSQLLVRNLDRRVVSALKARAASRGRSAEAEHRAILEQVLLGAPPAQDFKAYLRGMPAPAEVEFPRSRDRGRRVRL